MTRPKVVLFGPIKADGVIMRLTTVGPETWDGSAWVKGGDWNAVCLAGRPLSNEELGQLGIGRGAGDRPSTG